VARSTRVLKESNCLHTPYRSEFTVASRGFPGPATARFLYSKTVHIYFAHARDRLFTLAYQRTSLYCVVCFTIADGGLLWNAHSDLGHRLTPGVTPSE